MSSLQELLRCLASGEVYPLTELSVKLGVSHELLVQMLEHLERLGYVRPIRTCCQGVCQGCGSQEACARGSMWVLAEKGLRAAKAG